MASRNERKRRAKAKELALKQAVSEAFKREAAKPEPIQDYSRPWCIAGLQRIHEKSGVVQSRAGKRQLITREPRSEEHTSELQSLMRISYAVLRLNKKTTYKK